MQRFLALCGDGVICDGRAAYDAAILAAAGVPAGLPFVRAGRAGVSHSPSEVADAAGIAAAAGTLTRALTSLAERG
jgi:acetylornithine deacetylase/succinyl-diaminopimelate desuccinylase-like protein